jgi:hypothetical protein
MAREDRGCGVSDYEMPPTEVRIASLDNQIANLVRELAEKRKDRARFVAKLRRERLSRAPSGGESK